MNTSSIFSKEVLGELSQEFCESTLKFFGSFHLIQNPVSEVLQENQRGFSVIAECFFCHKLVTCEMYAATKSRSFIFNVCNPCMQDFNMHNFNPSSKDYCRLIKEKRPFVPSFSEVTKDPLYLRKPIRVF